MSDELGTCPACSTALIRNKKPRMKYGNVQLSGKDAPDNAYYPNFYHTLYAVWCPACGLTKELQSNEIGLALQNPEFIEWVARKQASH